MKKLAVLVVVLLLAVTATAVSAQEKEVHKESSCKSSSIDSETKVKLEKLKLQYELAMVDLDAEKEKIHGEIMAELMKEAPSTKTLEKLGKSASDVKYKMFKTKIDYALKVKKVLPADYWKGFLHKYHGGSHSCGCGCHGCKGSSCCSGGKAGHKCGSGCTHGSSCSIPAGAKGHTCTPECTHSSAGAGCETTCVKIKK
jgi:hypothetical protein